MVTNTSQCPRIGVNGFGLQSLEAEMFSMLLVVVVELWII